MKTSVAVLCALVSMAAPTAAPRPAANPSQAIVRIARILLDFTHVPTPSQKATLEDILDDHTTTAAERVLARAVLNVEHVASPDDKPQLQALIRDESAPPPVKTVATILSTFSHTVKEADRKKLRQLVQQSCE